MQFSIDWLDNADNAAPEEQATVGDLRLFIGEQNATQFLLDSKVDDHITVALYSLAHGLAHDWWTIFGARDREISLLRYRTGYLLPDIRLSFDGAALEVTTQQRFYENPKVKFWGGASEVMSRKDGEAWLSDLIEMILARLKSRGINDTSAALRWRRVQSSRHSEEHVFCEAAGALNLDPYQVPADIAEFIEKAEQLFQDEALVEFVSGASSVDKSRLIEWVERMTHRSGAKYRLAELRPIVDEIVQKAPIRPPEPAWAVGYRRARAMREVLNLEQSHRFSSFRDLAKTFGASDAYNLAPSVNGIRALRREFQDGIHIHLRNHGDYQPTANVSALHLFAMARAAGDAACFPEPQLAPINSLIRASRQAAGRAFAAEFLAPIDEIRSMQQSQHDLISIASSFAVSPALIEHQIENSERITEACS